MVELQIVMEDSFGGAKPKTPRRPSRHLVTGNSSIEDNKKPKISAHFRPLQHPLVVPKGKNSSKNRGDNLTQDTSRQRGPPLSHEDTSQNSEESLFFKDNHYDSQENKGCKQILEKNGSAKSCQHCQSKDRKFIREFLPLTDELIQNAVKDSYTNGDDNGSSELEQPSMDVSGEIVLNCSHGPGPHKKKNKELTAREKWKKSGYALRKYLSSKFGFGDVSSRKSSNGKSSKRHEGNCNSVRDEKLEHLEHDSNKNSEDSSSQANPISRSSSATSNGSEGRKDWSISFLKMFDLHREKPASLGKVSEADINKTRTDFSSSPSSPLQDTDSDWQSHLNPANENAQYKPSICDCDCDWSIHLGGRRNTSCDWSTGSHDQNSAVRNPQTELKCERWRRSKCEPPCKVKKSNKRVERKVPRKHLVGLLDDMLKSSSDTESEKSKPTSCSKRRRRKSKDSSRSWYPAQSGEKCVESTETQNQAGNNMETGNQGLENGFRNQSTQSENDASGPGFVLTGQPQKRLKPRLEGVKYKSPKAPRKGSDVLLGLKYALPYLPERLRNRLHSSSKESDHEQLSVSGVDVNGFEVGLEDDSHELDKGRVGECVTVKGKLKEQPQEQEIDLDTYSDQGLFCRNRKMKKNSDVEKSCIDMKSNPSSYGEDIKRKELMEGFREDVDLEAHSGSPHHHRNKDDCIVKHTILDDKAQQVNSNMKKRVCDTKFHLNDSGTWTMTLVDGEHSDNDLSESQGHGFSDIQGRFHDDWYRSRDRQTDWLQNDLTLLEASLEDPFNLRGDNLIINPSPTKANNSVSFKGEYSDKGTSFPKGCNSPNVNYSHSKEINSLNLGEDGLPTNSTGDNYYDSSSQNIFHEEDIKGFEESSDCFSKLCSGQIDDKYVGNDAMACSSEFDISNGYLRRKEDPQKDHTSDGINPRKVGELMQDYFEGSDLDLELLNQTRSLFKLSDTDDFSTDQSQHNQTLNAELKWDSLSSTYSDDESSRAAMLPSDVDQEARSVWRCDNAIDELCSGLLRISPKDEEERNRNIMSNSSTLDDLEMERSRSLSLLTPESSLDADDEFECDCDHCLSLRYTTLNQLSDIESSERYLNQRMEEIGASEYLRYQESAHVGTDMHDLQSLDLIGTNPGQGLGTMLENVILQLLADNVIMQMIAVRPDLLSDQAPPPATQSIIDDIPTVSMSKEDLDQNPVCPVCLCPCVIDETMSRLPCLHIFHPICVQAWLVKSGTCPVCRYRMTP